MDSIVLYKEEVGALRSNYSFILRRSTDRVKNFTVGSSIYVKEELMDNRGKMSYAIDNHLNRKDHWVKKRIVPATHMKKMYARFSLQINNVEIKDNFWCVEFTASKIQNPGIS